MLIFPINFYLGRDTNNRVLNSCMGYQMDSDNWKSHSQLIDFREEAASVVVAGQVRNYFLDLQPFFSRAKKFSFSD